MASDPDDPRIGDISEGAVLRAILARTAEASHTLLGPGDDAAVIAAPPSSRFQRLPSQTIQRSHANT